ncbi:MAG: OmpH family outer membrane protein [bacterium]
MKFLPGLVLLAGILTFTGFAKEYKVGFINSERIIARYEAAIEAKKELNTEIAKYEAKAESLKAEYEQAKEEYESQQLSLSEEGKRAKLAEVESRKRRYDSYLNEVYGPGGKIEQKNQELIAPIVARIDSAVSKVALEEGFTLVIDATKSGIVYSETGLDLTEMVLEELNRQYAPTLSGIGAKVVFVIAPIYESNDEAQRDRVGTQIRGFVNALIGTKAQVEVIPDKKVDEVVQTRGYTGQEVGEQGALDVARALDADYCIFGDCSKRERRIQFKLTIIDVRTGNVLKSQEGEAERSEVLREKVSNVVQVLYSSLGR